MAEEKYTVACLKWGTKYTAKYVNVLYSMVQRNLTLPHRFVCATDDPTDIRSEVEILPLHNEGTLNIPDDRKGKGWWYKLMFFKNQPWDLAGKILFLDLDVVIVDNIDCFFERNSNFSIVREWNAKKDRFQSSVFCLDTGSKTHVWNNFSKDPDKVIGRLHGDQDWMTENIREFNLFPSKWVQSYKYHCKDSEKPPENAKIISFHGRPNPHEAHEYQDKKVSPSKWVKEYWKE